MKQNWHLRCFSPKPPLPTPCLRMSLLSSAPLPFPSRGPLQLWSHSRVHAPPMWAPPQFLQCLGLEPFLIVLSGWVGSGPAPCLKDTKMRLVLDELAGGGKHCCSDPKTLSPQMFTGLSPGVWQNRNHAVRFLRGASAKDLCFKAFFTASGFLVPCAHLHWLKGWVEGFAKDHGHRIGPRYRGS